MTVIRANARSGSRWYLPLVAEPTKRKLVTGDGGPTLEVGDQAPQFTLRRTFEQSVSLSELLASGGVLLVFYVFDFGHV